MCQQCWSYGCWRCSTATSPPPPSIGSGTLSVAITWIPCIQFQERKISFSVEAHSVLHKYIFNSGMPFHSEHLLWNAFHICMSFHIPFHIPFYPLESCVIISYNYRNAYIQCNHDVIYVLFSIVWHLHGIVLLTVH